MKKQLLIIPTMLLLNGCFGIFGGGKKSLPDVRTQVPGTTQVNNYLDTVTTPDSVHCVDDGGSAAPKPKSLFHDGYAKITTNHVGGDVSHQWDASWDTMIDETLEEKFSELISEEFRPDEGDLIQLGCPGFSVASKADKKRFWALFLASLARVQSGFDPAFQKEGSGLFGLSPERVNPTGGECANKDKFDFMEPSYSFACVLQLLKIQMGDDKKLLRAQANENTFFPSLTGQARYEFIKFFKAHASPQFAFCSTGITAPKELTAANTEGESTSNNCTPDSLKRINESLDRSPTKSVGGEGSGSGIDSNDAEKSAASEVVPK